MTFKVRVQIKKEKIIKTLTLARIPVAGDCIFYDFSDYKEKSIFKVTCVSLLDLETSKGIDIDAYCTVIGV